MRQRAVEILECKQLSWRVLPPLADIEMMAAAIGCYQTLTNNKMLTGPIDALMQVILFTSVRPVALRLRYLPKPSLNRWVSEALIIITG